MILCIAALGRERQGTTTSQGVSRVDPPDDFSRLQPLGLLALPGVHCDPVGRLCGQSGHLHTVAAFDQALLLIAVTHWGNDAFHHFVFTLNIKEQTRLS